MKILSTHLWPGLVLGLSILGIGLVAGLSPGAAAVAATSALCALWWTTQPVPIAATSLLPFVLLPLAGALDAKGAAAAFGHRMILLLLGGFLLSTVMESSGAHQRVALTVVRAFRATGGARAIAAFMAASAVLSMWISNTATTLMLLPVALAVISDSNAPEKLAAPLLLGMAWSANIGGMATPVGTPPNPLLMAELERHGQVWGFLEFMAVGLPVAVLLLPLTWLLLSRGLGDVRVETVDPGPWNTPQVRALLLFAATVLLWVTRSAPFGGWSAALELDLVGDHTVAIGMAALGFLVPDGSGSRLLRWETAARIPWDLLLLFAGGLALGEGFRASGLDTTLAAGFQGLGVLPGGVVLLLVAGMITSITELLSNTATAALLLPVLGKAAVDAGVDPAPWLTAATLAASCAFMMPIATAPNAIVFGTGKVPASRMAGQGALLNLTATVVIATMCWLVL